MTAVALLGNYRSALRHNTFLRANEPGGEKTSLKCYVMLSGPNGSESKCFEY